MTAPALPRDDQATEQVFDLALEEHAGDGEACFIDDAAATHVYRHGPCLAYICDTHAKKLRNNMLIAGVNPRVTLWCERCGQKPLYTADITVRPI